MLQNAKKKKFSGVFSIAILRKSSSYMTSYQDALVSFAFYYDLIRSYFTSLCSKNRFLCLSLRLCVVARSVVNIQHSIGCLVVFSWYDVISHHLQKVNKSSVHTLRLFFYSFLIFNIPRYSNRFDYSKDI